MNSNRAIAITLSTAGAYYAIVGALLWLAPGFFYSHVGHIDAYNPHYERDVGSFTLPLGIGLIFASLAPAKHRLLVAVAAFASLLHAISHLVEGVHSLYATLGLLFLFVVAGALFAMLQLTRRAAA